MTERKDYNSSTNQSIKRKFVEREVIQCFSYSYDEYIAKNENSFDDWENLYTFPEQSVEINGETIYFDGGSEEDKENFIKELEEIREKKVYGESSYGKHFTVIQRINADIDNAIKEIESLEYEPAEIMEYWLVTEWLYNKLKDHNEPVFTNDELYIWGRCATGQAILLDYVISEICEEMEILDGQNFSWAEKN